MSDCKTVRPSLINYQNFKIIGDSIDVDCTNSRYCKLDKKNKICKDVCPAISEQLDNIATNIKTTMSDYETTYCKEYDSYKKLADEQFTYNSTVNDTITTQHKTITENNTKLTTQKDIITNNIKQINELNNLITSSKAQNEIGKSDNVYIGNAIMGLGFEISQKSYLWSLIATDTFLFGLLLFFVLRQKTN